MGEVRVIADSTSLRELLAEARPGCSYVVRRPEGDRVLSAQALAAVARDEDFENVLRAADLAQPAARVRPDSGLSELARALRDAEASAALVYDRADHPLGVVTRDALAEALLEWFTVRVSVARQLPSVRTRGAAALRRHRSAPRDS
jgi:hypothetical protein